MKFSMRSLLQWKIDLCQREWIIRSKKHISPTPIDERIRLRIIRIQWICKCLFTLQHKNDTINQMRNIFIDVARRARARWAFIDVNSNHINAITPLHTLSHTYTHTHIVDDVANEMRVGPARLSEDALGKLRVVFVGWLLRFQFSFRLNSSDFSLTSYRLPCVCVVNGNYQASVPAKRNWR